MADTGLSWSAWDYMQYPTTTDWNDHTAPDDGASLTSEAVDLSGKAACEVGIRLVCAAGTPDTALTIKILGATGDDGGGTEEWEDTTNSAAWGFSWDVVATTTQRKRFSIDPAHFGKFKLYMENETNIDMTATTVEYRTATVPAAS